MDIVARPLGEQPQQCRTCTHGSDRLWNVSLAEVLRVGADTEIRNALKCHPTKVEISRRIRRDGILIPVASPDAAIVAADLDAKGGSRTDPVFVETCGYQILPKCRNCARLRTVEVTIPHDEYPNSTRKVVITGACSIPAEGLVGANGSRIFCDPKPVHRLAKIEPSCENCKFRFTTDENWQLDDFSVNDVDLTPYEMEAVRQQAQGVTNVGRAINEARLDKAQSVHGRYRWYPVTVKARYDSDDGTSQFKVTLPLQQEAVLFYDGVEVTRYVMYRDSGNLDVVLPPETMRFHLLEGNKAALEIRLPWQAPFSLVDGPGGNDGTLKRTRRLPPLPDRIGVEYRTDARGVRRRVWAKGQDYFAAKRPTFNDVTGEVELHPPVVEEDLSETGLWRLNVINDDGWRVVDDRYFWHKILVLLCGHTIARPDIEPHVAVFNLRLRWCLDQAQRMGGKEAKAAILRQHGAAVGQYPLSAPYATTPGMFRPNGLEAFKEYCSLNLANPDEGIDFRSLFGDSFGLDRTSYSRTWTYEMERDQWYRATHAGNEVQGEIMRNEMLDPAWPDISRSDEDKWERLRSQAKRIVLDAFGNEIDDAADLTMADRVADVHAYLDWLDEPVARETEDGTVIWEDRRMQVHGYTMYRGSRLEATPNYVINEAEDSIRDQLYCRNCDKAHSLTTMHSEDDYLPQLACPDCGSELYVGRSGGEPATWVRMGKRVGIGTAIAADSTSYQARQRLRNTVCPSWRYRRNPNITYDDVLAQPEYVEPLKPALDKAVEDINEFEFLGIDAHFVGGSTSGGYLDRW